MRAGRRRSMKPVGGAPSGKVDRAGRRNSMLFGGRVGQLAMRMHLMLLDAAKDKAGIKTASLGDLQTIDLTLLTRRPKEHFMLALPSRHGHEGGSLVFSVAFQSAEAPCTWLTWLPPAGTSPRTSPRRLPSTTWRTRATRRRWVGGCVDIRRGVGGEMG